MFDVRFLLLSVLDTSFRRAVDFDGPIKNFVLHVKNLNRNVLNDLHSLGRLTFFEILHMSTLRGIKSVNKKSEKSALYFCTCSSVCKEEKYPIHRSSAKRTAFCS